MHRCAAPFFFSPLLFLASALPGLLSVQAQPLQRYEFQQEKMGTAFNIVLFAPDSSRAREAADAAYARIDTLNRHLSDYLAESELSLLSATAGTGQHVPLSHDLWTVLAAAQHLARESNGAFDVTVGPLTRLWRWAMRRGQLPPTDRLERARRAVGFRHLVLDSLTQTALLKQPDMQLDLGGIAKGYAVDEALAVLQAHGLSRALVDGGGDIRLGDPPPETLGWRIAIDVVQANGEKMKEHRLLANQAVATSGATYRFVEVEGVRYSHLLNPHTGIGMTDERMVTVIAPTGLQADALASALSILEPSEGLALIALRPDAAARIIQRQGKAYHQRQSPTFKMLFVTPGEGY